MTDLATDRRFSAPGPLILGFGGHVDQVYPGQEAVLWFSAVPARATPEFEGHVVRAVAAHVVRDAESGPILVRGRAREQPTWPSPLYVASTVLPGEASLIWRPRFFASGGSRHSPRVCAA